MKRPLPLIISLVLLLLIIGLGVYLLNRRQSSPTTAPSTIPSMSQPR